MVVIGTSQTAQPNLLHRTSTVLSRTSPNDASAWHYPTNLAILSLSSWSSFLLYKSWNMHYYKAQNCAAFCQTSIAVTVLESRTLSLVQLVLESECFNIFQICTPNYNKADAQICLVFEPLWSSIHKNSFYDLLPFSISLHTGDKQISDQKSQ